MLYIVLVFFLGISLLLYRNYRILQTLLEKERGVNHDLLIAFCDLQVCVDKLDMLIRERYGDLHGDVSKLDTLIRERYGYVEYATESESNTTYDGVYNINHQQHDANVAQEEGTEVSV